MATSSTRRTNTGTQQRLPRTTTAPQNPRPARRRHDWPSEIKRSQGAGRNTNGATGVPARPATQSAVYTIPSYLDPQQFLKNKSCNHRQNEEQPNPVHPIARDFNITIRVIDRNGIDRTILRQRRFCRGEHTLPEVPPQADSRN